MKLIIVCLIASRLIQSGAKGLCCKQTEGEYFPSAEEVMQVDDLQRIPCNSTRLESFRDTFEIPKVPVILVGCDELWPAKSKWVPFKKLAKRFDSSSKWRVVELDNHYNDDDDERIPWKYIGEAIETKKRFYVFDNLNTTYGRELEHDYETPPFFRHDLYKHFKSFPPDYGPMRWFALGSRFTGTTAHYDPFETDAWNTVVHGMKWWILFPQNAHKVIDDDYEMLGCDSRCSDKSASLTDYYETLWRSPKRINKFFQGQPVKHVLQKKGETLYIPNGIIHSVMNLEDTIAITANYANANNNIVAIWDNLFDFDADFGEMTRVYCQVLSQRQRDELAYDYYCDYKGDRVSIEL